MKDMKASMAKGGKGMGLKDNTQASSVRSIPVNSEQYDMGRIKNNKSGPRGYPSQAIEGTIYK